MKRVLLLILVAILTKLPCSAAGATTDRDALVSANADFAFRLLKEISRQQPERNIFISPYSVSTVLQMVENGAGGKTKEEFRQVLGIAGLSQTAQNEGNRELNGSINAATTNLVLKTANAIWYRQGIPVSSNFTSCNQQFYQASVEEVDFSSPTAVGQINSWVNEQTRGKIPVVLPGPIDPLTHLYLANAVYFQGGWLRPFKVSETKDREFYLRGGKSKQVPMMLQGGEFFYEQGRGFHAVRLPYQGWGLGMYIFLPDGNSRPERLLATMTGDNWRRRTQPSFKQREGRLRLPRFKFECSVDLQPVLKALGIKSAFALGAADFSAMSREALCIDGATQKSSVVVNEEGTEAAAAAMLRFRTWGIAENPPKPFEMIVDRPFLVIIADEGTQTILFMGIIFDPSQDS